MPTAPITIREEVVGVDDVVYVRAEAHGSALDCVFVYRPDCIIVAIPNFNTSARIGYGFEWHYVAEKLDLPDPDAQTVAALIHRYNTRPSR